MGIREISASSFVRQGKRSSYLPPRLTRMDLANTCIGKKYLAFTIFSLTKSWADRTMTI